MRGLLKMLNEYVIKFRCKKCKKAKVQVYPCHGDIAVMKAGLKNPGKCKSCGKSDWLIFGILNVEV